MFAFEGAGRAAHRSHIEAIEGEPERSPVEKWRWSLITNPASNAVAIALARAVHGRIEVRASVMRRTNLHILRKPSGEGSRQTIDRDSALRRERRNLIERMNARIRSTGTLDEDGLTERGADGFFEHSLDCSQRSFSRRLLTLPAMEFRALVRQMEPESGHASIIAASARLRFSAVRDCVLHEQCFAVAFDVGFGPIALFDGPIFSRFQPLLRRDRCAIGLQ